MIDVGRNCQVGAEYGWVLLEGKEDEYGEHVTNRVMGGVDGESMGVRAKRKRLKERAYVTEAEDRHTHRDRELYFPRRWSKRRRLRRRGGERSGCS
jgi:hypothetical protein